MVENGRINDKTNLSFHLLVKNQKWRRVLISQWGYIPGLKHLVYSWFRLKLDSLN